MATDRSTSNTPFGFYCGWPKASHLEGVITEQWTRICEERGEGPPE
jgi:4-carboxymuconolactone decarboxylase